MTSLTSTRNEKKNLICREMMHMPHTYMHGHLCFSQITGNIVISSNCRAQIWKYPICTVIVASVT